MQLFTLQNGVLAVHVRTVKALKEVHTDETENESTNQIIEDWTASSDTHQALSRQYEKVASKLNNLVKYSRHGLYCPG